MVSQICLEMDLERRLRSVIQSSQQVRELVSWDNETERGCLKIINQ